MNPPRRLSPQELRTILTPMEIRNLQIIQTAIGFSATLFLGMILLFYLNGASEPPIPEPGREEVVRLLSFAHAFIALTMYAMIPFIARLLLHGNRAGAQRILSGRQASEDSSKDEVLKRIRAVIVVRLAMYEAAAMFGLVVCLLGVITGVIYRSEAHWLNAITALVLFAFVIKTFPNQDRLIKLME